MARWVLFGAVAVHLLILQVLFIAFGAGKNTLLTIGNFVGMHVAAIMMVQLVLVARLPWLDRRIGMDRLTSWHRWVGFTLFWGVLLHALLVVWGFAALDGVSLPRTFVNLAGVPASLLGMLAAGILIGVVAVSVRYVRRRLRYEVWHALHLALYATVLLGLVHQFLEGTAFSASAAGAAYWWTTWALVLAALVIGRVVVPLRRNALHQFRVAKVVPESDDAVSVYVTGRHLDRLPVTAGQFFIWRFPGYRHWWGANPFSLSAAPDGGMLRLTAKAVGSGSAGLRDLPVGTRVFAEGPYGAFTAMHRARRSTLLIAGGVGVTPIRSLLEELDGSVVVLYRARTRQDAVLLGELEALVAARGARLHLLTGRTGAGPVPTSPFEPDSLVDLVPDIAERDVYVCGPPAMTAAVLRSLRQLRIPARQVHAEQFTLA